MKSVRQCPHTTAAVAHLLTLCTSLHRDFSSECGCSFTWELRSSYSQHGVFVTHNGDFHSFELFGRRLSCVELMAWLAMVLDAPAPARCDSVAIAGET